MNKIFWAATAERAVKTFAQALIAALTMSSIPLDILHANWVGALSLAGGAALLSVCTSLSSIRVSGDPASDSFRSPAKHLAS